VLVQHTYTLVNSVTLGDTVQNDRHARLGYNPVLAEYINNHLANAFYAILRQWAVNEMRHLSEDRGRLLHEPTSPPILQRAIAEFGEKIT
jgi:hypothetical protein